MTSRTASLTEQNTKRLAKATKELFADYVKEKKLREPEEQKVRTNFESILCRSEKERWFVLPFFFRSMYYKTIIRFDFCDTQNSLFSNCHVKKKLFDIFDRL